MDPFRGLNSGQNFEISGQKTSRLDSQATLGLESCTLTAGRDVIIMNSSDRKHSLSEIRLLAQWLSSPNQYQFHKDILDKVTEGTGEWIFKEPKFLDWLNGKTDILWGTGIPGAGKTCLSSIIIEHLIHSKRATVVFFYCQYKEQLSINEVLACLLRQMVDSCESRGEAATKDAMALYTSCNRTGTRPSRLELSKTLRKTVQNFDNLCFVIDALDELSDDTRSKLITELAALQLPLLMTSRPLPNLLDLTPIHFIIRPPDDDCYAFISTTISRVSKLRPFLRNAVFREELIKTIQNKCDGMFLLATLQIEALASAGIINPRSLWEAVDRLPETLNDQYKVTVQRIQSQSLEERDLAMRIVLWVTHATRLLNIDELLEAMMVDVKTASVDKSQRTNEETLISVCLGLVTVEKESQIVRLIHFSAQEFFESHTGSPLINPHTSIANVCAIYLKWDQIDYRNITSNEKLMVYNSKKPLIEYSCYNLGHHTNRAIKEGDDQVPMHVVKLLIERERAPISLRPLQDQIDLGHAIHFAASYGLVSLFEKNTDAVDQMSLLGFTPLFYACLGGHSMLVERIVTQHRAGLIYTTDSITLHRGALNLRQPPRPDPSLSLSNPADSLRTRFAHKGAFQVLEECMKLFREALALYPLSHPLRSAPLGNLAIALSARFTHTGAFEDLEECITLHREALDLRRPPHSAHSMSLNNLAASLSARFTHTGAYEDLEECITLYRKVLDLYKPPHPDRSTSLNNLATSLSTRFEQKGTFEDLEECITLYREALDLYQPHLDDPTPLNNLATSLFTRFKHKGAFEDLEECIPLYREALDLCQPPHPARSMSLSNLAASLSTRCKHKGAFEDLEECITLHRKALDLYQPPHPARSISLNNLAASLSARFEHKGAFEDLEECITLHRKALDLYPWPHPARSISLNNLAASLSTRFEQKGTFEDLEECITLYREALDLYQPHLDDPTPLNNLATSLFTRFKHKGAFEDLEECIPLYREALDLCQPPHPARSILLSNLTASLFTRYKHKGAFEDLEEYNSLLREAPDYTNGLT